MDMYPRLEEARTTLRDSGASVTLLAGSGSSIFAVFPDEGAVEAGKRRVEGEGWNAVVTRTLAALPPPSLLQAGRS
jgi:4-diphosphocytidyl-2C-methyl-D-erythritol kinase